MNINQYERLKESGFDIEWLDNVYKNFIPKETGKYSMLITSISELDDNPAEGLFIEKTYFDNPEDLYKIHNFFEGFGYVMNEVATGETIGEGIIDYSPFDEMESHTGQLWEIPDIMFHPAKEKMTNDRKAELADCLIAHLYDICSQNDLADVLKGIGFTDNEIDSECECISDARKCQLYPEMINHLSEICKDEKDFVDVLRNLGFTDEEIETERLLNFETGPLATDIDALITAANELRDKNTNSHISDKDYYVSREEYQM